MVTHSSSSNQRLQSGDLLLFDGDSWTSQLVKFFTSSCWSHIGIVYKCPKTKELYIWENGDISEASGPIITRKGCPRNSAHLVPLKNRLGAYEGLVYVRRLLKKKKINQNKFDRFVSDNLGNSYSWDLVASWNQRGGTSLLPLSFLEDHTDGQNGWICSQLVVLTYEHLGVMTLLQPSHTYMPVDFAGETITTNKGYEVLELELLAYNLKCE